MSKLSKLGVFGLIWFVIGMVIILSSIPIPDRPSSHTQSEINDYNNYVGQLRTIQCAGIFVMIGIFLFAIGGYNNYDNGTVIQPLLTRDPSAKPSENEREEPDCKGC